MKSWLGGKMTQLQAYRSIWVAIANTLKESANPPGKIGAYAENHGNH